MQTHLSLPISSCLRFDVVILGGGVSGSIAAIAAARLGAGVLLVEEHGFLGGSLTSMGVGPMMSFHNPAGEQVVNGIPDELIQRLVAKGGSLGHIPDSTTYCSTVTPFDSEALKIELEAMIQEAGGTVLYHTQLAAVTGESNSIESIVVCNKAGLTRVQANVFVDASGDGDLAARAGAPFQRGREKDEAVQPMTMNLKLANVDTAAIRRYAEKNPTEFSWTGGPQQGLERLRQSPRVSLAGYRTAWKAALESGEVDVPRDIVLFFETSESGVVIVNTSRVIGFDPTDPFQLSQAESLGRRQCVQIFNFLRRHAPGFSEAIRMDTAPKIGVRESRHILGQHVLTDEDLISRRAFPDVIALGGYPIDIHSPGGEKTHTRHLGHRDIYEIPMGSLIPRNIENLVVVGRCISATHEAAAAFRVTPIAMAVGQAGGVIAGEACRLGLQPAMVPHQTVQATLRTQGARLPDRGTARS